MLTMAALSPHPPILVPEVGGNQDEKAGKTIKALKKIAADVKLAEPEMIVFISPHGPAFSDAVTYFKGENIFGDFSAFGSVLGLGRDIEEEFGEKLEEACKGLPFSVAGIAREESSKYGYTFQLDHGVLVPLYYLDQAGIDVPIFVINMAIRPYEELYEFGRRLGDVIEKYHKRAALVISGDMSHCLSSASPGGYAKEGAIFDSLVREAIAAGDVKKLYAIKHQIIERAGECGLRPVYMGLGVLDGWNFKTEVLSYEGPWGVGYLTAEFFPERKSRETFSDAMYDLKKKRMHDIRKKESAPVKWARASLEHHILHGGFPDESEMPVGIPEGRAGVFVSLKKDGVLRGCVGTIVPTEKSVGDEIKENVLKSAFEDNRFPPVQREELSDIQYSVDVLGDVEKINSKAELDVKKYGLIVEHTGRRGLLLPNLEGINSVDDQIAIAKRKAGIKPWEKVTLERFEVRRYE